MSYCNGRSLTWVGELRTWRQLDPQKEGVLKRTADSGIKHRISWLMHPDPGCQGLGDGPEWFEVFD